ncbi:MAG: erythromycin esterase family protein, partial [Cyanobacteriota bacterium]
PKAARLARDRYSCFTPWEHDPTTYGRATASGLLETCEDEAVRMLQDLLAFDFYTDRIYRSTIVAFVAGLARITNGFDQVVVNGLVNRIGRFSLASAEGLKLGVSGQMQTYVLTTLVAIVLLLTSLSWFHG